MIALLLFGCITLAANTWTVDDNGPADFAQIADAVAQVPAGDVLLVEPGDYAGFTLTQPLTILSHAGSMRPHVHTDLRVLAPSFTLAGFDIDKLHVQNVSGRGRIDDCRVNVVSDLPQHAAVDIAGCSQLVISRTTVWGSSLYGQLSLPDGPGSGMSVQSSTVTLVGCAIFGGAGKDGDPDSFRGGPGGIALSIEDGSRMILAGSKLGGGFGGSPFGIHINGDGGPAVVVKDSSIVVRGSASSGDYLLGNTGFNGSHPGLDVDATGSTVVMSGVFTNSNFSFVNTLSLFPAAPEPFVEIDGSDVPGGTRTIEVHGPAGHVALLAASLASGLLTLGKFEGELWFDPAALIAVLPVSMTGQDAPVGLAVTVPASTVGIEGLAIEAQAFFPTIPGGLDPSLALAGNVAELIIRF